MIETIVTFLCLVSGVARDAQQRALRSRASAATLGALMLIIAMVSTFTSGYAVARALASSEHSIAFGVFFGILWGTCVLCIDRLMVIGFDKYAPWRKMLIQVAVRVPLALTVSVIMSTPLFLSVAQPLIQAELRREVRERMVEETKQNATQLNIGDRTTLVSNLRIDQGTIAGRLQGDPDSPAYLQAARALDEGEARLKQIRETNGSRIATAEARIANIQSARAPSAGEATRITAQRNLIREWRNEIGRQAAVVTQARKSKEKARDEWLAEQRKALQEVTEQLHVARGNEAQARTELAKRDLESEQSIARDATPNLINDYRMIQRVSGNPKNPNSGTARIFQAALHFFFFILELTPIAWKALSKVSPLDDAVRTVDEEKQDSLYSTTNTRMARQRVAAEIEEALLLELREQRLNEIHSKVRIDPDYFREVCEELDLLRQG